MQVDYRVDFESDNGPVVEVRGRVAGGSIAAIAGRAARDAKRQAPRQHWSSIVMVFERVKERAEAANG